MARGVRYRDSKRLVLDIAVRGLRMREFAQTWRFECTGKRSQPHAAPTCHGGLRTTAVNAPTLSTRAGVEHRRV